MPALSDLLAFVGATVVLLLIPGPAVIYMLNRTLSDGRRVGLAAVAGYADAVGVHKNLVIPRTTDDGIRAPTRTARA